MDSEIENIDTDWLNQNNWFNFKLTPNHQIYFHFFYIQDKKIVYKKQENITLNKSNLISSEEIMTQIKNNQTLNKTKFSIVKINYLFFNYTCDDLKTICCEPLKLHFQTLPIVDDLVLNPTLDIFQDLNTINIFYYSKQQDKQIKSKKKDIVSNKKSKKRT